MDKRTSIILVVIFVALAGYVVLTGQNNPNAPVPTATAGARTSLSVWSVPVNVTQLTGAAITRHTTNQTLAWDKVGDTWQITLPITTAAADAAAIDRANTSLLTLTGFTLTASSDLSAFGVLSPTATLRLTLTDGQRLELVIGDKTPTGSQYYGWRAADSTLFTIASFALDDVWQWLAAPPVVAPQSTPIPLNPAP